MTIETVTSVTTLDVATSYVTAAFETCQEATIWLGHSLESGFTTYIMPAAEKLCELAMQFFGAFQNFAQSSPIPLVAFIGGVVLISIAAFKYADSKAIESDEFAKRAYQTLGAIALVSAVALTSLGMAAVLV